MKMNVLRKTLACLSLALMFSVAAPKGHAADVNGRIRGTVADPTGAVLSGIEVVAINEKTGVKYTTKTNANGSYLFPQLPVGTYDISVTVPNFTAFLAKGIVLNIDQEYTEQVVLTVGSQTQTAEVSADSVQVNTSDMQLNNIVTAGQMEELPLIGRNFTALETTLPGVQATDSRFTGTYSVSGAQAQQSSYMINGADTNDIALNTIAFTPNLDAIAQFNLVDGPLNAEYDRNSGGIVSATIKSGTNHFHGNVFEFYRDTFLNTNNFFQKTYSSTTGLRTDKVAPYHQHIFGGTIGGPVFRDKLFFFGAYQGTRQRVPEGTYSNTVYTTANLSGDFSGDLGSFSTNPIPSTITIPGCTAGQTFSTCLTALGGHVPTSAFNSVAKALAQKYVPAPNSGTNSYSYQATTFSKQDQIIGRVDYNPTSKDQITVVGIWQTAPSHEDIPFSGASVPGFGDGSLFHVQQWTLDYTRQLSSSMVNDFAAHYTRFNFNSGAPQQVVAPSSAGFQITPQDTSGQTLPTLAVSGFFTLGGTNNGPQPRIDQVIQVDDSLSKTIGRHNLKFGYDGRRFNVSNTFDNSNSGSYSFNTSGTFSSGDASLDFLLGIPASYGQGTGSIIQADAYLNYLYAQDSWKATDSLTLDFGLGYSIDTPLRNHQYGGEAVDCFIVGEHSTIFPGAPTNMVFPGDPGCHNSGQAVTHYNEFGPRFGFAWAPDLGRFSGPKGKFAIRGGFGIYYDRTEEESALQTLATPPFGFTTGGAGDFGGSPQLINPYADINGGKDATGASLGQSSEANRFPYSAPVAGSTISFAALEPIYNISTFDSSFRAPYSENFQLSVERELPSQIIARVSYVGALGRHNQVTYEGDYETAAGHAACVADPTCQANRNLQSYYYPSHTIGNSTGIIEEGEVGSYSSSNYNSLQISVQKAPTHGLTFQLSYTYSHALDDASSFENSGFGNSGQRGWNQYQKNMNYGNSTFDARHRLVFAPVYISPILHGYSAFSPINLALSGWEVSGIMTLATGEPFDISYAGTTSRSLWCSASLSFYACPDVPVQTGRTAFLNPRARLTSGTHSGRSQYFDTTVFAAEPIGQFGNIGRNPYHGPGINNTNMILAKNFNLNADGTMRLQLRIESDNVFNHTQFSNPTSTYGNANFGYISSAAAARQSQLGAKFFF